ncbi:unnamed protein product, partial [Meganyctiphanes norvegica]
MVDKLYNAVYGNGADFAEDMRLIFNNCYLYNKETDDVFIMAKKLEDIFEKRFVSVDEKEGFTKKKYGLNLNREKERKQLLLEEQPHSVVNQQQIKRHAEGSSGKVKITGPMQKWLKEFSKWLILDENGRLSCTLCNTTMERHGRKNFLLHAKSKNNKIDHATADVKKIGKNISLTTEIKDDGGIQCVEDRINYRRSKRSIIMSDKESGSISMHDPNVHHTSAINTTKHLGLSLTSESENDAGILNDEDRINYRRSKANIIMSDDESVSISSHDTNVHLKPALNTTKQSALSLTTESENDDSLQSDEDTINYQRSKPSIIRPDKESVSISRCDATVHYTPAINTTKQLGLSLTTESENDGGILSDEDRINYRRSKANIIMSDDESVSISIHVTKANQTPEENTAKQSGFSSKIENENDDVIQSDENKSNIIKSDDESVSSPSHVTNAHQTLTINASKQSGLSSHQLETNVSPSRESTNMSIKYNCLTCGFISRSKLALKLHVSEKGHKCSLKNPLKLEQKSKTMEKSCFECTECGLQFKSSKQLQMHKLKHSRDHGNLKTNSTVNKIEAPKYICGICGFVCKGETFLKLHTLTHKEYNCHKCSVCNEGFEQEDALREHIKTHELDALDNLPCLSDKSPASKNSAIYSTNRSKSIGKESDYSSDISEMLSSDQSPEKLFNCDNCEYKCGTRSLLKTHMWNNHIRNVFHSCALCNFRCNKLNKFRRHLKQHADKNDKCKKNVNEEKEVSKESKSSLNEVEPKMIDQNISSSAETNSVRSMEIPSTETGRVPNTDKRVSLNLSSQKNPSIRNKTSFYQPTKHFDNIILEYKESMLENHSVRLEKADSHVSDLNKSKDGVKIHKSISKSKEHQGRYMHSKNEAKENEDVIGIVKSHSTENERKLCKTKLTDRFEKLNKSSLEDNLLKKSKNSKKREYNDECEPLNLVSGKDKVGVDFPRKRAKLANVKTNKGDDFNIKNLFKSDKKNLEPTKIREDIVKGKSHSINERKFDNLKNMRISELDNIRKSESESMNVMKIIDNDEEESACARKRIKGFKDGNGKKVILDTDQENKNVSNVNNDNNYFAKNRNPLKCTQCDFSCKSGREMKEHFDTHTKMVNKDLVCPTCGFRCKLKIKMKHHMKIHSQNKYRCSYCDFGCSGRNKLKEHTKVHLSSKKLQCSECDFHCELENHMDIHKLMHDVRKESQLKKIEFENPEKLDMPSNSKEHMCSSCGFKVLRQSQLKKHKCPNKKKNGKIKKAPSSKIKTRKVKVVNRTFSDKVADIQQNLSENWLNDAYCEDSLDGDTFACTWCDDAFITKFDLQRHEKIHRRKTIEEIYD